MEYNENFEEVGENQQIEERRDCLEEYFEKIRKQISVIKIDDEPYDFIEDFVKTYLNYDMIDMLETREIYADPKLSQEDREDLHTFVSQLNEIFNTSPFFNFFILFITLLCKYALIKLRLSFLFVNKLNLKGSR